MHEQSGLFDHDQFDSIQFSDYDKRTTHVYRPWTNKRYVFDYTHQMEK